MRKAFSEQQYLGRPAIEDVELNLDCRDEIIPILEALKHIYAKPELRGRILELIEHDVNKNSRRDCGREGMEYWHILVLAAVRLGCNLDYDKLQDLAEQHRALRLIMGLEHWCKEPSFGFRRIHDNLTLLRPETIEKINHLIVSAGYQIVPEAAEKIRADSFVAETNIHYPTESSLLMDGIRVIMRMCVQLACVYDLAGWRQHEHLLKKAQKLQLDIQKTTKNKGRNFQKRLKSKYRPLIQLIDKILHRAEETLATLRLAPDMSVLAQITAIEEFIQRTRQVRDTAQRRVLEGEDVPNEDKLFSIFEPHTQLYKRGKARESVQFGRLVLIYEDSAGFIPHYYVMPRDATDSDVLVAQTQQLQDRLEGCIQSASFDRGFHSPDNQIELAKIVPQPCLPKKGAKQLTEQLSESTVDFRQARQHHPGVESAIGALQQGNGLERSRDRTEVGFERYIGLGILGRNLHALGKVLIARKEPRSKAAETRRKSAA